MKTSLRFTAGAFLVLAMQAVCFAQHYTQTNRREFAVIPAS